MRVCKMDKFLKQRIHTRFKKKITKKMIIF